MAQRLLGLLKPLFRRRIVHEGDEKTGRKSQTLIFANNNPFFFFPLSSLPFPSFFFIPSPSFPLLLLPRLRNPRKLWAIAGRL